jgi:hypothetical protein
MQQLSEIVLGESILEPCSTRYSSLLAEVQAQVLHSERSEVAHFGVLDAHENTRALGL